MNKDFIVGNWKGILSFGRVKLEIKFIIKKDNQENLTANLISPTHERKIESYNITIKNKQLQIELDSIGGKFEGISFINLNFNVKLIYNIIYKFNKRNN
ncbi:MAG: hypothetical protein ACFFG0_14685 [Candidatus Thorarchaeota archaeon]